MPELTDPGAAIAWLRTPEAIRARAAQLLEAAKSDRSFHFALDPERLEPAADYVIETIRRAYPDLDIPYHSRWRHFAVGGRDRWRALAAELGHLEATERARIRFDLVIASVLLDAGAGESWCYVEPTSGERFRRSEGLALASFDLFRAGLCSARPGAPLRADAAALARIDAAALGRAFQVRDDNPLIGLEGRAALLRRLGGCLAARPALFGDGEPRIGHLFDHLAGKAQEGRLTARAILAAVLEGLADIWPGRIELAGVNLGDVGRHRLARSDDLTDGLVPFHKLSQWLAYSLIEPLEEAGIEVVGLDGLTPLAEYRNGGLLIDLGVLRPKHPDVLGRAHPGHAEIVVEWRALTLALIEALAERIRTRLGLSAEELPLAKVLEGGTWAAGRRIARARRPDGAPPLRLVSDGTLF